MPSPPEREVLTGASDRTREEPAGQLLARLPWAGVARAGAELTAEEFFGAR